PCTISDSRQAPGDSAETDPAASPARTGGRLSSTHRLPDFRRDVIPDCPLSLAQSQFQPFGPPPRVVPERQILVLAHGIGGVVADGRRSPLLVHADRARALQRAFLNGHGAVGLLQHVFRRKTKAADARGLHFGAHLSAVPASFSHRPSPSNAMSTRYVASCPTPASAGRRSPRSRGRPT